MDSAVYELSSRYRTTAGGCHVPSPGGRMDGDPVFGRYTRMTRQIGPSGEGSPRYVIFFEIAASTALPARSANAAVARKVTPTGLPMKSLLPFSYIPPCCK